MSKKKGEIGKGKTGCIANIPIHDKLEDHKDHRDPTRHSDLGKAQGTHARLVGDDTCTQNSNIDVHCARL